MVNVQALVDCLKGLDKNSADQDQTASEEAVWSGSSLFAILTSILPNPALISNKLFLKRIRKVFKILEILPYYHVFTIALILIRYIFQHTSEQNKGIWRI